MTFKLSGVGYKDFLVAWAKTQAWGIAWAVQEQGRDWHTYSVDMSQRLRGNKIKLSFLHKTDIKVLELNSAKFEFHPNIDDGDVILHYPIGIRTNLEAV